MTKPRRERDAENGKMQLVVGVPIEMHDKLQTFARANDLTMAQIVRAAVRGYLSEHESLAS